MQPWSGLGNASLVLLLVFRVTLGTDASDPADHVQAYPTTGFDGERPIEKRAVSSRIRLVFFAGLEGTGHHYLSNAFRTMYNKNPDLQDIVRCDIAPNIFLPSTMSKDTLHYQESEGRLRSALRALRSLEGDLPPPGAIVTFQKSNRKRVPCPFDFHEISYPNNHGPNKALSYPDLTVLARVSEEEGVDLRIVYLHRSALDLLLSNIVHRGFHNHLKGRNVKDNSPDEVKFLEYVRIILTDAAALHSSLVELGCGFVICHSYDRLADEEQALRMARFLSPTAAVAEKLKASLVNTASINKKTNESLAYIGAQAIIHRLQTKLDIMKFHVCNRACR